MFVMVWLYLGFDCLAWWVDGGFVDSLVRRLSVYIDCDYSVLVGWVVGCAIVF